MSALLPSTTCTPATATATCCAASPLAIAAGRSLGLLGRNGMGKTTLIRTALGYVRAAGGSVAWQGRAMTGAPPEQMARLGIGYVPEGRGIFPNLSVRENLVMTRARRPRRRRDWTLERVLATFPRLAERLGHGGQQLSGGEQQMLAIGRALLTNPLLLILDEATEGLAPLVVAEIWRTIADDPRDRHRHADRRPQRARRARPHRRRRRARERPRRPRRRRRPQLGGRPRGAGALPRRLNARARRLDLCRSILTARPP